jgi:hypothetical protein
MEKNHMDFEESLNYIVTTVEDIKKEIIDIRTRSELQTFTLKDIAEKFGYKIQTFRNQPWKMPNYGRPDVDLHPARWYYNTIQNWYAIPEDDRRLRWESMTSSERLELLGKSQKREIA